MLQEIQAGAAVDLGKIQVNMDFPSIAEGDEVRNYLFVVQECKFVPAYGDSLIDAGFFVKIVIVTEALPLQKLVNHFTAFAAKRFVPTINPVRRTSFSAMKAAQFLPGNRFHGINKDQDRRQRERGE
jgi:hypothetical protein